MSLTELMVYSINQSGGWPTGIQSTQKIRDTLPWEKPYESECAYLDFSL